MKRVCHDCLGNGIDWYPEFITTRTLWAECGLWLDTVIHTTSTATRDEVFEYLETYPCTTSN